MRGSLLAASVLACAGVLEAQVTAIMKPLPDRSTEIRLRNDAATTLAAYAISAKPANDVFKGPLVVYADSAIDREAPVLPRQERITKEARRVARRGQETVFARFEEPVLAACIFADGSTAGDPALLRGLLLRRSNMLAAVETAIDVLLGAGSRNVPRGQLIEQFTLLADSLHRWYLPPEQQVGCGLYQSIAGKLINLPKGEAGSPFPPSAFVAQETAALNRQRVSLLATQPSLATIF